MTAFKIAFLAALGWTLGCYIAAAARTIIQNTIRQRNAARKAADLAAANAIMDQWAKMPERDLRGRFARKGKN